MNRFAMTVGLGMVLGLAGLAAGKGTKVDSKLPREIQDMYRLVGTWEGKVTMQMGESKSALAISWACEPASLGYGVSCRARFTGMPGGSQEESDLFGFDPGARKYHWFSVTSMGETHDHVAEPGPGSSLKFVYDGVSDGKPMRETIVLTFNDNGTQLDLRNEGTIGGKPAWSMNGSAVKK
jgi:hypothetical protein